MKKLVIVLLLLAGITAIAFASFNTNNRKAKMEKKMEKKRQCKHYCPFS